MSANQRSGAFAAQGRAKRANRLGIIKVALNPVFSSKQSVH